VLATGCSSTAEKISIRPVGDRSAQQRPGSDELAYGRAQLRLGNVGTALEAFRKVQRQQPDNAEALAGIADSYTAMGRDDVARRYYEAALAMAPDDPALLKAVSPPAAAHAQNLATAQVPTNAATPAKQEAPIPEGSASVTVQLPPATPAALPHAATAPVAPHLERVSPAEVALVTTAKPMWQAVIVARTSVSTTVRWVPIRSAAAETPIRVLNAARYQGLAARTRRLLYSQGWRRLAIGDAPRVRSSSLVLFPATQETRAKSLAAQLGFRAASTSGGDSIIVLLGRDAARFRMRRQRA
jgi:tetratricopeptide (TPR) repeat protein